MMRTGTPVLTREFGMVVWTTRSSDSNSSAIRRAVFSPPSLATIKWGVRISTQGSIFSFFSFSGFWSLSLSFCAARVAGQKRAARVNAAVKRAWARMEVRSGTIILSGNEFYLHHFSRQGLRERRNHLWCDSIADGQVAFGAPDQ